MSSEHRQRCVRYELSRKVVVGVDNVRVDVDASPCELKAAVFMNVPEVYHPLPLVFRDPG